MTSALADLLWQHITQVTGPQLLPGVAGYFGLAFVRGVTVFTLVDLVNALGIGLFDGGRVDRPASGSVTCSAPPSRRLGGGVPARGVPGNAGRRVPAHPRRAATPHSPPRHTRG